MIFFLRRNNQTLFAAVLIIAFLTACLLSPWFHQHPGRGHAEVKGDFYHLQASAFTSDPLESEKDRHAVQGALHLLEGSQLFDKMQASVETHFGQVFISGKYVPQFDFSVLPSATISLPVFTNKTTLKLQPVLPAQDYFALTATGLSPPLA